MKNKIAIIGSGISGLTLAQNLRNHAHVVVYEKARGVGGRMSTRYADDLYFDHGAQYFTARGNEFIKFLKPFVDSGTVVEWHGRVINLELGKNETEMVSVEPYFVAQPNMITGLSRGTAKHISIHRWKYAVVDRSEDYGIYLDTQRRIAATSDWTSSSCIEDVWKSAQSLSERITLLIS